MAWPSRSVRPIEEAPKCLGRGRANALRPPEGRCRRSASETVTPRPTGRGCHAAVYVRVPHPGFPHGVAYTKHAEVSLEEMTIDNVVVTDIPTSTLLHGTVPTSVGHNLNREILRLRADINAVIHAHHDETIAFFAAGAK